MKRAFALMAPAALVCMMAMCEAAWCQDSAEAPAATPAPAVEAAAAEPVADAKPVFRKRLPNYYTNVVDDKQREAIYAIQLQYFDQIAELKLQIAKLEKERNEKIEAVLTEQQKADIAKIAAQAKAAREKK